jgi:hypothetical protein
MTRMGIIERGRHDPATVVLEVGHLIAPRVLRLCWSATRPRSRETCEFCAAVAECSDAASPEQLAV